MGFFSRQAADMGVYLLKLKELGLLMFRRLFKIYHSHCPALEPALQVHLSLMGALLNK